MSALLRASHPLPGAAVTIVALVLALAIGLEPWRVALVTVVMALDQLSVGWSNDWIDADRDRVAGRLDKPVARGEISRGTVRAAALAALLAAIGLGFVLGPAAGAAHLLFIGSAWAYNAGLKRTALSALPYLVAFGALPAIITYSAANPTPPTLWSVFCGAALGFAAHLVNVLPDLDDDARTGVRGLPHRLGLRASGVAAFAALVAAGIVPAVAATSPATVACAVVISLLAAAGAVLVWTRPPTRMLFAAVLACAVLIVAALASSGAELLEIQESDTISALALSP